MTIHDLYATPTYQRRDEYERLTSKPCPAYDPRRPQKFWEDPNLRLGRRIGRFMQYDYGLQRANNGSWYIGPFIVPVDEAVKVNIPPDESIPVEANTEVVPVPLTRDLLPGERLAAGFGGIPIIVTEESVGGVSVEDLDKMIEILGRLKELILSLNRR